MLKCPVLPLFILFDHVSISVHGALFALPSLLSILLLQIAQEISKKYKNRPVNIMGEINTV